VWVSAAGCAICHASAELLNRTAADLRPEELPGIARAMVDTFSSVGEDIGEASRRANGAPDSNGLLALLPPSTAGDFAAFLPLRNVPGRRRCATLPWELLLDEPINEDDAP
jgi:NifU-like protein involved in Fe-S cluster formation